LIALSRQVFPAQDGDTIRRGRILVSRLNMDRKLAESGRERFTFESV
jgi:hypothetical protein